MPDTLTLSLPPTINHYYGRGRNGGVYKTKKAKDWEEEAGYILLKSDRYYDRKVSVTINFHMKSNNDIDNRIKIILDVMEDCHMFDNDKQVMELHVYKHVSNNQKVEIELREIYEANN